MSFASRQLLKVCHPLNFWSAANTKQPLANALCPACRRIADRELEALGSIGLDGRAIECHAIAPE